MSKKEYDMYQDIPIKEEGSSNLLNGINYDDFKEYLKKFMANSKKIDSSINTKTTRYIFYKDDYPIGEIGIRTTLNEYWINKGSQIFYKIRLSERKKGYGTIMLKLALYECKKLGFKEVYLNCNDLNIASIKVIKNNGGTFLFNYGTSSRYKITL